MKAFTIDPPRDDRFSRADATCQHYLPQLSCAVCERDWRALDRVPPTNPSPWAETEVWYPAFALAKGTDTAKFTTEVVVTLKEFESLRKRIIGPGVQRARLLPGSGIGPVRAKLPKRGTDFLWCGFKLLVSRRALEILERAGLDLPHGPVIKVDRSVECGYVAVQLDPIPLYSEQTLKEMTLVFCAACGQCWMQNVRAKLSGPRQYLRNRVPEKQGLAKAFEGLETLATERFMEVARSNQLTGIQFEEFGVYV